jgi:hypothetical protein
VFPEGRWSLEVDPTLATTAVREHAKLWGSFRLRYMLIQRDEDELVAKLVWRVNLVAELEPGLTTEVEVARIERDQRADLVDLGLRLAEAKQLTAALQAEMVPAQVTIAGECHRSCATCGHLLAGNGSHFAQQPGNQFLQLGGCQNVDDFRMAHA